MASWHSERCNEVFTLLAFSWPRRSWPYMCFWVKEIGHGIYELKKNCVMKWQSFPNRGCYVEERECRCGSESSQQQIIVSKQPLNPRGKPVCQSCFNLPYYDILSLVLRPPRRMQQNQNGGRSELILQSFKLKNIHLWYSFKSRAKLGFSLSTD